MEIEHINEDTIRVIIESTDLEERGITFLDLLSNQQQIEKFFHSILEEVDIDEEFQESDAVTFQVMPNNNGLELFISKGTNFKEGLTPISNNFNKNTTDKDDSVDEVEGDSNETHTRRQSVIKLETSEQMISLAQSLYLESGRSTLYLYNNHYYLHLLFFVEEMTERTSDEELAIALEFGEKSDLSPEVLSEYGKKLIESNALELTRYHFN